MIILIYSTAAIEKDYYLQINSIFAGLFNKSILQPRDPEKMQDTQRKVRKICS